MRRATDVGAGGEAHHQVMLPRLNSDSRRNGGRAAYYLGRPASQWIEALAGCRQHRSIPRR